MHIKFQDLQTETWFKNYFKIFMKTNIRDRDTQQVGTETQSKIKKLTSR